MIASEASKSTARGQFQMRVGYPLERLRAEMSGRVSSDWESRSSCGRNLSESELRAHSSSALTLSLAFAILLPAATSVTLRTRGALITGGKGP
jgi:hypothetical protein